MSKPVKKLFDLEIDEVSVVDRAANQHSLIAFSKAHGEDHSDLEGSMADMAVFEETGELVDVDDLEHGDLVYDEQGNEYVFLEDGAEELEEAEVGKAGWLPPGGMGSVDRALLAGRFRGQDAVGRVKEGGKKVRRKVEDRYMKPRTATAEDGSSYMRGNQNWRRNRIVDASVGGTGLALAGGGVAYERTRKSLGESVLEELSKAVTDRDREQIIAKALGEVEIAKAEAAAAMEQLAYEQDLRIESEFISKAAEYNLPVSPAVLGPILKSMAEVLDDEQLGVIDELFSAVGDALYNEIGYVGESSNSSVLDQVDALAEQYVGKAGVSREEVMTAMFEANPSAYDAYIAEMGR